MEITKDEFGPEYVIRIYDPKLGMEGFLVIDNTVFSISSANFDYRSFRYQYEIALIGKEPEVLRQLNEHLRGTLNNSDAFNYKQWADRPLIE